jgi:hypothetical protein
MTVARAGHAARSHGRVGAARTAWERRRGRGPGTLVGRREAGRPRPLAGSGKRDAAAARAKAQPKRGAAGTRAKAQSKRPATRTRASARPKPEPKPLDDVTIARKVESTIFRDARLADFWV